MAWEGRTAYLGWQFPFPENIKVVRFRPSILLNMEEL